MSLGFSLIVDPSGNFVARLSAPSEGDPDRPAVHALEMVVKRSGFRLQVLVRKIQVRRLLCVKYHRRLGAMVLSFTSSVSDFSL